VEYRYCLHLHHRWKRLQMGKGGIVVFILCLFLWSLLRLESKLIVTACRDAYELGKFLKSHWRPFPICNLFHLWLTHSRNPGSAPLTVTAKLYFPKVNFQIRSDRLKNFSCWKVFLNSWLLQSVKFTIGNKMDNCIKPVILRCIIYMLLKFLTVQQVEPF
jgi:hypothetical protein